LSGLLERPTEPAACAVCNPHLQSFAKRHAELCGAGVRVIVFFQPRTMYLVGAATRIEPATQEDCE
jgi:hypothetical protein